MKFEEHARVTRSLRFAHAEAFKLMRYSAKNTIRTFWVWNSRDGVTPFGAHIEGIECLHKMNEYIPSFFGILPDVADYVWVSYDREQWAEMKRKQYDRYANLGDETGADFVNRYPSIDDWLKIDSFQFGSPLLITRREYLELSCEWYGGVGKAP